VEVFKYMGQTTLTDQNSILAEIARFVPVLRTISQSALQSGFRAKSFVFQFANKNFKD